MTERKLIGSEEAGEWLSRYGIAEEHWQDVIDLGLYNHDIRTMAHIALSAEPVDYIEKFTELLGDDRYGEQRIDNARHDIAIGDRG